jgi:hypothetical protein
MVNAYPLLDSQNAFKILIGKPEGKRTPERCKRRSGIILKYISKVQVGRVWSGGFWLTIGSRSGLV